MNTLRLLQGLLAVVIAVTVHFTMKTVAVGSCDAVPPTCTLGIEPSSYGEEFIVAIPASNQSLGVTSQLILGTPGKDASYSVETVAGGIQLGDVSFGNPAIVTLSSSEVMVLESDYSGREKGIRVRATGEENVFVLVATHHTGGFGNYLAYPCPSQDFDKGSYEYFAVSTASGTGRGQVVLVACRNDTKVQISPKEGIGIALPEDAQDPSSPLVNIDSGNSHTVFLNQMQTLLISAELGVDLTGTKITSNKPLTVVSGHECSNVPESFMSCEQLAVQVPPTLTWGTEFLLAPFAGRTSGQYYKVVSSRGDTTVVYKCGVSDALDTILSKPGESLLFMTTSFDYCYLYSSDPVLVVQLATGGFVNSGGDGLGDPVMAIVSPIQQHVSRASFLSLELEAVNFATHAISVTVTTEHFCSSDIFLDGLPLDCVWNEIQDLGGCVVGFGCTMTVANGSHTVSHNGEDGLLSVMAYGFNGSPESRGYAYTAGLNLKKPLIENNSGSEAASTEEEGVPAWAIAVIVILAILCVALAVALTIVSVVFVSYIKKASRISETQEEFVVSENVSYGEVASHQKPAATRVGQEQGTPDSLNENSESIPPATSTNRDSEYEDVVY